MPVKRETKRRLGVGESKPDMSRAKSTYRPGENPNSLKNLKPAKPGEVRNPTGKNRNRPYTDGKRSASTSGRRVGRCGRWPEVDTYGSVHLGNKWTLRSGQLLRENHRDDGGRRERSVGSSNRL